MSSTFNQKKASPAVLHSTLRSMARGSRLGLTVDLTGLVEKLVALGAPSDLREAKRLSTTYLRIAEALYEQGDLTRCAHLLRLLLKITEPNALYRSHCRATMLLAALLKKQRAYAEAAELVQNAVVLSYSKGGKAYLHQLQVAKENLQALANAGMHGPESGELSDSHVHLEHASSHLEAERGVQEQIRERFHLE